jgi:hypothetical protein
MFGKEAPLNAWKTKFHQVQGRVLSNISYFTIGKPLGALYGALENAPFVEGKDLVFKVLLRTFAKIICCWSSQRRPLGWD